MSRVPFERYAAVILAAGGSVRMGRQKLLLPWGKSTIIGHIVEQWKSLVLHVAAVVREPADEAGRGLTAELERVGLPAPHRIVNTAPESGMFSSICGAAAWPLWPQQLTHFVIVLGDQPHLDRRGVLVPLLSAARHHPETVLQPAFRGAPKHPVVLPRKIFFSLADTKCGTLREALARMPRAQVPIEDPLLNLDLDTPTDYEHALRVVFGGAS